MDSRANPPPGRLAPRDQEPGAGASRIAAGAGAAGRTVFRNLAVEYAIAVVFTTYLSAPNEIAALLVGPAVLVVLSALFGLAVAGIARLRRDLLGRWRPMHVWLVSAWLALLVLLLEPLLPALPFAGDRPQAPARELGSGALDHRQAGATAATVRLAAPASAGRDAGSAGAEGGERRANPPAGAGAERDRRRAQS